MIRACLRRVALASDNCNDAAVRRFCSIEMIRNRPKEIRDCKLIGTLYQNPMDVDNGSKLLTIKTVQPDNHYKVHRAFISSPKILSMVQGNLRAGQRVYVSGELRCQSYVNEQKQNRQRITIQVNELYANRNESASDTPTKSIDLNNVSMLSNIASEIQHFDGYSRFYLSSNFVARNPVDGKSEKVAFYNIFCHDPDLIDYVKNNLQKRDRVFLNGFLNSKPDIDENGKKVFSGFIEATNIMKIDRFLELSSENRMRTSGDE